MRKISIVFDNPVLVNGSIDRNLNFLFETINKPVPSEEEKIELLKSEKESADKKEAENP